MTTDFSFSSLSKTQICNNYISTILYLFNSVISETLTVTGETGPQFTDPNSRLYELLSHFRNNYTIAMFTKVLLVRVPIHISGSALIGTV